MSSAKVPLNNRHVSVSTVGVDGIPTYRTTERLLLLLVLLVLLPLLLLAQSLKRD